MKKLILPLLIAAVVIGCLSSAPAGQNPPPGKPEAKQPTRLPIPKEVGMVMSESLKTKQARLDIPFEVFKSLILPARDGIHSVFFFKAKNADLGFASDAITGKMKAQFNAYALINKVENGVPTVIAAGMAMPTTLEADAAGFDPGKEEWYSFGVALFPGDYNLTLALTPDNKKIGIQHYEFKLPDPKTYTAAIDTTPLFFTSETKRVEAAEMNPLIHKGWFAWSILQMTPLLDNAIPLGKTLNIFFFIFGCQPAPGSTKYNLEAKFEVYQGDKIQINWAPGQFDSPLITLDLPLKQTLQTKEGDKVVKTEQRDLPPGTYTFVAKITDKTTGLAVEKRTDFTVK